MRVSVYVACNLTVDMRVH